MPRLHITTTEDDLTQSGTAAIDFLVEQLNTAHGMYMASGTEYAGRYSRWDIGFVNPPLEIVATQGTVRFQALNPRGHILLEYLHGLYANCAEMELQSRNDNALTYTITYSDAFFPEEERSQQPFTGSPLRRLLSDLQGQGGEFLGLYGAFAYDLLFEFEPIDFKHPRAASDKLYHVYLPDEIYVRDRRKETTRRFSYAFKVGAESTDTISNTPFSPPTLPKTPTATAPTISVNISDQDYARMVDVAKEHIKVGDVFQVVLSRRFSCPTDQTPADLYTQLMEINASPYQFFLQMGEEQLVGASPEMYLRVDPTERGLRVESCPIAGTIRRTGDVMSDVEQIKTLLNSKKDEAELTMCTDVDRNDKARVCKPGTVRLLGRRHIEAYRGLYHTVDHVEGILRDDFTGMDAFLSHMWTVTLTGAPKKIATQLIENYEAEPREWYCGAVGYLLFNGQVNTGTTIRAIHLKDGEATYRAGAGVVYDSDGMLEAEETRTKANSFFKLMGGESHTTNLQEALPLVGKGHRIIMIDYEDSFVHTLADYFRQTGADVITYRHSRNINDIIAERPSLVVHSPGPRAPKDFGVAEKVKALAAANIPQFGVCLGLQGMVEAFGGSLNVLETPWQGKTWHVTHTNDPLFEGLPNPVPVGAYHALYANRDTFPKDLQITAENPTGLIMAITHKTLPLKAAQFHPESILTQQNQQGHRLIHNAVACLAQKARPLAA